MIGAIKTKTQLEVDSKLCTLIVRTIFTFYFSKHGYCESILNEWSAHGSPPSDPPSEWSERRQAYKACSLLTKETPLFDTRSGPVTEKYFFN